MLYTLIVLNQLSRMSIFKLLFCGSRPVSCFLNHDYGERIACILKILDHLNPFYAIVYALNGFVGMRQSLWPSSFLDEAVTSLIGSFAIASEACEQIHLADISLQKR